MMFDMKSLAKANRDKALAKGKASKTYNNIVTTKTIKNLVKESVKSNSIDDEKAYADLVKRSEKNYKLCVEHPGLIGKLDHVCYSEGLYIMNTVTKEKELIF